MLTFVNLRLTFVSSSTRPSVPFIHSDGATAARDQQTIKHEYCRSQELELEDLKYEYTSFEAVQCLHFTDLAKEDRV